MVRHSQIVVAASVAIAMVGASSGCRLILGQDERQYVGSGGDQASSATSTSESDSHSASSTSAATTDASSADASSSTGMVDCGNTLTSDENCGHCGHLCAVGHCHEAQCDVIEIVESEPVAEYQRIVVDQAATGYVYWSRYREPGKIMRAKKQANARIEPLVEAPIDGAGFVFDIAANDDTLFFSDFSNGDTNTERGYYAVDKTGANLRMLGGSGIFGATGLSLQGNQLFVRSGYDTMGIGWLDITLEDQAIHPWIVYSGLPPIYQGGGNAFLVAGPWAYFSEQSFGLSRAYTGQGRASVYPSEYAATVIATGPGARLYWVETSLDGPPNMALKRGSVDGAAPIDTLAVLTDFRASLVHDDVLYFTDAKKIFRVNMASEPPVVEFVLASDDTIGSIASDDVSLFWLTFYDGRVYRQSF